MNELKQRWRSLREAQPGLRIRDAASRLGVSEAALLETRVGDGVLRLAADIRRVCEALPGVGMVMSLVRNEAAVHEKDAAFVPAAVSGDAIRFAGGDFSLDIEPAAVGQAFYVEDANPKGALRSIQLFDASGGALWKIYARDKADQAAFRRLVDSLALDDGGSVAAFLRPSPAPAPAAPAPVRKTVDLQSVLERIAERALPLSLEVANRGVSQRHRGPVHRIVRMGSWLNVLDPGFDWHLDENAVATTQIGRSRGRPCLTLRLADGGEAAVIALDDRATDSQAAAWQDISRWTETA